MPASIRLVAGLGKTGQSIARYLQRKQQPFVAFDTRTNPPELEAFKAEFPTTDIYLNEVPEHIFPEIIEIINSPGVSLDDPMVGQARVRNIPVIGDIECFAREVTAPVIAITGTNGKSTVTSLVGEMLEAHGLSVMVAGNIGVPVLDVLAEAEHYDAWVLELSSFQLELTQSLAPVAATILNITPDHLDRHHSLGAYIAAKQRIYTNAKKIIVNRDDVQTYPPQKEVFNNLEDLSVKSITPQQLSFGLTTPKEGEWGIIQEADESYLARGDERLMSVTNLRIQGRHNWANALAACALAETIGVTSAAMVTVLQTFAGLAHRSQWVRTLDEVSWINDSKGTNVGATVSAIAGIGGAIRGKIVLIAGGQGKGADFTELRTPVLDYVRSLVLIGEDADRIADALGNLVPRFYATSLDDAVKVAKYHARPGDVVLLSPACASFDMFRDFNHRGEHFINVVTAL